MTFFSDDDIEIDAGRLATIIRRNIGTVIVDCRCFSDYNVLHVKNAVNAFYSKLMRKRIEANKVDSGCLVSQILGGVASESVTHMMDLVLYADDHEAAVPPTRICQKRRCSPGAVSGESSTKVIRLLKEKLEQASVFNNVMLLKGGFDSFRSRYPDLCESSILSGSSCSGMAVRPSLSQPCLPPSNDGPTQILSFLYLGSQQDALNASVLKKHRISYVLNLSMNCPKSDVLTSESHFMRIPVNDNYQEKLLPHFEKAYEFLENVRQSGSVALIHCLAGISRSPTLAIAYIMKSRHMNSDEAYRFVKQRRPSISPNFNFMGQLLEYEKVLREQGVLPQKDEKFETFVHDKQDYCPAKVPKSASSMSLFVDRRPCGEEPQLPNENGKRGMGPAPERPMSLDGAAVSPSWPPTLGFKSRKALAIPSAVAEDLPSPSSEFSKLTFAAQSLVNPCFVSPETPCRDNVNSMDQSSTRENPIFNRMHSSFTSTPPPSTPVGSSRTRSQEKSSKAAAETSTSQPQPSRFSIFSQLFKKSPPTTLSRSATMQAALSSFSSRPDYLADSGVARETSAPVTTSTEDADSPESGYQEEYKTSAEQDPERASIGSASSLEIAVQ